MSESLHPVHPTTAAPTEAAVVWLFDPWRERPRAAWGGAAASLALCALVVAARLPFVFATALCVAVIASFSPVVTPVACRVDRDGVARRGLFGWERRAWASVARLERVHGGLLASPFASPHVLDRTRALLLPLPASRRDALRIAAESFRGRHGR